MGLGVVLALARSLGEFGAVKVVTAGGVAFLQRELASLPRVSEVGFDPGTLLLAVGLALASGLFVTLSPIVTLLLRQPGGPVSVRSGVSPGVTEDLAAACEAEDLPLLLILRARRAPEPFLIDLILADQIRMARF